MCVYECMYIYTHIAIYYKRLPSKSSLTHATKWGI